MIAQFLKAGNAQPRLGIALNGEIVDLTVAAPTLPRDMLALMALGAPGLEAARSAARAAGDAARLPLNAVEWLPPVVRPGKIICLA